MVTDNNNTVYAIPYGQNTQITGIKNNKVFNRSIVTENNKSIQINAATSDANKQTWVVTDKFIGKLNARTIDKTIDLVAETKVILSHEEALWYQENNALIKFNNNQKKYFPIYQDLNLDIRSLSLGFNGDILIADKHNLYKLAKNKISKINIPIGISSCIHEYVEGEIWACSDGLWLQKNNKNHHFDYKNNLTSVINGHIHDVRTDENGNIWAIANSGLFRLSRNDLDDYLTGKNPTPLFAKFSEQDNIKSSEFNGSSSSSVITKDGKLWFASQGGVVNVNPSMILPKSDKILKPYIEHFSIGDEIIAPNKWDQIAANPKTIQFGFGAVHLSDNKNISFRYKLLPYHSDDDWHYSRIANIPELNPGTYQLTVQAKYHNNKWSPLLIKTLTVAPAWYQTWWFRFFALLMIIILLYVLPQWRLRRLKSNRNELKKLVHKQTESLLEANKRLDMLSRIDELTRIPNRREFINKIKTLCNNTHSHFCLALIDIDNFKAYNDSYGHIAGDECLKNVSKVIMSYTNELNLVARFGGEEFVVLFNESNIKSASSTLKKIHESIKEKRFSHNKSQTKPFITLSSGLVSRITGESVESIIERADLAMYKAKSNGKDQIVIDN